MGLYLVAGTGDGVAPETAWRPRYFQELLPPVTWVAMPYGPAAASLYLVHADLDAATEAILGANTDFFIVPPLASLLTVGQVTAIQARLEALGVPAHWISTELTWRQVLRGVATICQLAGRARVSIVTANLDLRLNQIPVATRTAIQDAAVSLGFSLTGVTGATTVRQALRALATQWVGALSLGGETL